MKIFYMCSLMQMRCSLFKSFQTGRQISVSKVTTSYLNNCNCVLIYKDFVWSLIISGRIIFFVCNLCSVNNFAIKSAISCFCMSYNVTEIKNKIIFKSFDNFRHLSNFNFVFFNFFFFKLRKYSPRLMSYLLSFNEDFIVTKYHF